jgi:hypothetical protein
VASVTIPLADADNLPPVCAACGQPATSAKAETYNWNPSWVLPLIAFGLLPWVLFLLLTRRTATLAMPLCGRHTGRGRRTMQVLVAGFAVAGVVGAVGYFLHDVDRELGEHVLLSAAGVVLLTGVAALFFTGNWIRAKGIDARTVTLDGVSVEFARAVGRDRGRRSVVPAGGVELTTAKYFR